MAPGADKIIKYDPAGAIGLFDSSAFFGIRFDETSSTTRPKDYTRACQDFTVPAGDTMPSLIDGTTGRARLFNGTTSALQAADIISGTTLETRDLTIQAIVKWNEAGQGDHGCIVSRGGESLPSIISYGLAVSPMGAGGNTTNLHWIWNDSAGGLNIEPGIPVTFPLDQWTMLTVTRRWISPTSLVLRYYIGDFLLAETTSAEGDIGGATTGLLRIGHIRDTLGGVPDFHWSGGINEIQMFNRELTAEEVEATWLRLIRYQPLGEQLYKEMISRGFPIDDDPGSDVQRENRMIGQTLGFVAGEIEELRSNFLPGRSYGRTLEQWEEVVQPTPQPDQDIDTRRRRVLARMRQRRGISIPGVGDALADLLGGGDVEDLEFLAFSNTITDDFAAAMNPIRWDIRPLGSWASASGSARCAPAAGDYKFNGTQQDWLTARMPVGGEAREAQLIAKVSMPTPEIGMEAGIYFGDAVAQNYVLLGRQWNGADTIIVFETFENRVSPGPFGIDVITGNPANVWLHLLQTTTQGIWRGGFSTTGPGSGFSFVDLPNPTAAQWCGIYVRSLGVGIGGAGVVNVDDFYLRQPFGDRPLHGYVLLDESLGFSPDIKAAQSVVEAIHHGFTHAAFITGRNVLCDDIESGCDLGPMGAI